MSHVQFKTLRWPAKIDGNWLRRRCQASGLYTTSLAYCTSIRDRNSDSVLPGRKDKQLGERLKPLKWPKRKGSFIEAGKKGKAVHLMTCKQSHSECNTEQLRYKQSPWLAQKEDEGKKKTRFHFTCKITTQNPHVTQPSAHHHSTNSHVGTSTSFRLDISSLMQSGRGKLGRNGNQKEWEAMLLVAQWFVWDWKKNPKNFTF